MVDLLASLVDCTAVYGSVLHVLIYQCTHMSCCVVVSTVVATRRLLCCVQMFCVGVVLRSHVSCCVHVLVCRYVLLRQWSCVVVR